MPSVSNGCGQLRWSFTAVLGVIYLAIFHLWLRVGPIWVIVTGVGASALLSVLFVLAAKRGDFINRWDGIIHAAVILDILLEGVLIRFHQQHSFYLCAAAFAATLVGYRWWHLRLRFS